MAKLIIELVTTESNRETNHELVTTLQFKDGEKFVIERDGYLGTGSRDEFDISLHEKSEAMKKYADELGCEFILGDSLDTFVEENFE